jgi:hypothetical protein
MAIAPLPGIPLGISQFASGAQRSFLIVTRPFVFHW